MESFFTHLHFLVWSNKAFWITKHHIFFCIGYGWVSFATNLPLHLKWNLHSSALLEFHDVFFSHEESKVMSFLWATAIDCTPTTSTSRCWFDISRKFEIYVLLRPPSPPKKVGRINRSLFYFAAIRINVWRLTFTGLLLFSIRQCLVMFRHCWTKKFCLKILRRNISWQFLLEQFIASIKLYQNRGNFTSIFTSLPIIDKLCLLF